MTRSKAAEPVSPRELQRQAKDKTVQAKKVAVDLVEKALSSHILSTQDNNNFVSAVCKALSLDETEYNRNKKRRTHSSTESTVKEISHKKKGRSNSFDDHDEVCEVCEKGGDLLCCDTCTLVFHLKCFRPKLSGIPKGSWSCPHCVIDDLADGDVKAAKTSIRMMNRLARGIDSDDDSSFTGAIGPAEVADPMRTTAVGEFTIVRKGKKFVLRQAQRKHLVDIGKYLSLEEAMNYIKEGEFNAQKEEAEKAAAATAAAAKKASKETKEALSSHSSSGSLSSRRRRGSPVEEEQTERDDWGEDAVPKKGSDKNSDRGSERGSERGSVRGLSETSIKVKEESDGDDAESSSSVGYDELWCTHCMDDKGVTICVFCGCKKCFGKYDSSLLILCDHCERETHTYCLDPPLAAVPEEDPWYCHSCSLEGVPTPSVHPAELESQEPDHLSLGGASGSDIDFGLGFESDVPLPVPGSSKKRTWSGGSADMAEWSRGLKKIRAFSEGEDVRRPRGKYQTKAILAAAAAASNPLAPPKQHRGRGRPPGSGKRPLPTTTGLGLVGSVASMPDFSSHAKGKPSVSKSISHSHSANSGEFKTKSRRSKSLGWDEGDFDFDAEDYGSFDFYDEESEPFDDASQEAELMDLEEQSQILEAAAEDEEEEEVVEETFELGAVGIRAALQVIARASTVSGKVEGGPWTEPELDLLDQLRVWAPVCDLEKAFAALQEQKELLVKRIQAQEPSFNCQDMEIMIAAQLAEARHSESALLGSSAMAGADSAGVVATAAAAVIAPAPLGIAAAAVVPKPKRVSKPKQPAAAKAAAGPAEKTSSKKTAPPAVHAAPAHQQALAAGAGQSGFGGAIQPAFASFPTASTSSATAPLVSSHTDAVIPQLHVSSSLV